jgi:hypothetical protein
VAGGEAEHYLGTSTLDLLFISAYADRPRSVRLVGHLDGAMVTSNMRNSSG